MGALEILVGSQHCRGIWEDRSDIAHTRCNSKVKGQGGPAAPARQVDIPKSAGCRVCTSHAILRRWPYEGPGLEQARFFELRIEPGTSGKMVGMVPEEVVAFSAVSPTWADPQTRRG